MPENTQPSKHRIPVFGLRRDVSMVKFWDNRWFCFRCDAHGLGGRDLDSSELFIFGNSLSSTVTFGWTFKSACHIYVMYRICV